MASGAMTAAEKGRRARLAALVRGAPLLRGTLSLRRVTCGKPTCRCARGEKHPALYLTSRRQGRVHQLFVPAALASQARQAVANYHEVQGLLERLSQIHWEKLSRAKRQARRRTV